MSGARMEAYTAGGNVGFSRSGSAGPALGCACARRNPGTVAAG
jgi:hypothetical protein